MLEAAQILPNNVKKYVNVKARLSVENKCLKWVWNPRKNPIDVKNSNDDNEKGKMNFPGENKENAIWNKANEPNTAAPMMNKPKHMYLCILVRPICSHHDCFVPIPKKEVDDAGIIFENKEDESCDDVFFFCCSSLNFDNSSWNGSCGDINLTLV